MAVDTVPPSAQNPLQPYLYPRASAVPLHGCKPHVAKGRLSYVDPGYGLVAFSGHERFSVAVELPRPQDHGRALDLGLRRSPA